jgi:hypothetical protein
LRRAIAKLDGIEESDIAVDYAGKTATIALGEGDPAIDAIVASVSGTQYTLTAKP